MYLDNLKLYNFRNLTNGRVCFSEGINYIHGSNGQGKTNLLEAVFFLSTCKSFRTTRTADLVRWKSGECSAFCDVLTNAGKLSLGISIEKGKRSSFLNGDKVKSVSDSVGKLLAVSFSPSDLDLVRGAPLGRRNLLDRSLVFIKPSVIKLLVEYKATLNNKKQLLKNNNPNKEHLFFWNDMISGMMEKITHERLELIDLLQVKTEAIYKKISGSSEAVKLHLKSQCIQDGEVLGQKEILNRINEGIEKEMMMKAALFGPHRDDLVIELKDHSSRHFSSQGQCRSIVLALKTALIEIIEEIRGEKPVLLLDDFESELDAERCDNFFNLLPLKDRQVFISGTAEKCLFLEGKSSLSIQVKEGKISM